MSTVEDSGHDVPDEPLLVTASLSSSPLRGSYALMI